jgi:hypothetical protein
MDESPRHLTVLMNASSVLPSMTAPWTRKGLEILGLWRDRLLAVAGQRLTSRARR